MLSIKYIESGLFCIIIEPLSRYCFKANPFILDSWEGFKILIPCFGLMLFQISNHKIFEHIFFHSKQLRPKLSTLCTYYTLEYKVCSVSIGNFLARCSRVWGKRSSRIRSVFACLTFATIFLKTYLLWVCLKK